MEEQLFKQHSFANDLQKSDQSSKDPTDLILKKHTLQLSPSFDLYTRMLRKKLRKKLENNAGELNQTD